MIEVIEKCLKEILDGKIKEYPLLNLLTVYYQEHITNTRESQEDENIFPVELSTSLIKRESGIFEALEQLRRKDVNLDEGEFFNPLMVAVAEADAPMTEYLIVNGADPRYWPDRKMLMILRRNLPRKKHRRSWK